MKYRKVQAATKIQEFTGFTGLLGSLRLTINAPITNRIAAPRPLAFRPATTRIYTQQVHRRPSDKRPKRTLAALPMQKLAEKDGTE